MGRTVCYYTEQLSVRLNLHCASIIRSRDTPTMFSYFRPYPTHSHASAGPGPASGESMWGLWGRKYSLGHIFSSITLVFSCQSSLYKYSLFIHLPPGGGVAALARYTQQYHRTTVLPHYGNTRKIYPNIIFHFILSFSVYPEAASPKEFLVSTFAVHPVSYFIIILPHTHTHTHTHTCSCRYFIYQG